MLFMSRLASFPSYEIYKSGEQRRRQGGAAAALEIQKKCKNNENVEDFHKSRQIYENP